MRNRKADLCPKCGARMRVIDGRDRTVPGGTWFEWACPRCLHREDEFRPRCKPVVKR